MITNMARASLIDRLRAETAGTREAVRRQLPFSAVQLERTAFELGLADLWGFYSAWESLALETSSPALLAMVRARLKVHLIEADLLALSHSADRLWRTRREEMDARWLPDLREPAVLLGSMYVLESTTLDGPLIVEAIERQLDLQYGWGYSFFVGYGPDTRLRWETFCAVMERTAEADEDSIVASATQTIDALHRWVLHRAGAERR